MVVISDFWFVFLYICVVNGKKSLAGDRKPVIMSRFETIIQANENHTILCQGQEPLNWTIPTVKNREQYLTKFNIKHEKPTNKSYLYASALEIVNMDYHFFGFYYCHYGNSNTNNDEESTSMYLYVNDREHLTTLSLNDIHTTIIVTQFQEAIIPCKPTSPNVHVTLSTHNYGELVPLDVLTDQDQTLYRYDPLYGFITNNTRFPDMAELVCVFQTLENNTNIQRALVQLITEIPISHLPKPYLEDKSEGHTVVGKNLKLECAVKNRHPNTVHFRWQTPNGAKNIVEYKRETRSKKGLEVEILTIRNARLSDSGRYFCNVTDNQNHNSFTELDVKVFGVEEHFLTVEEENGAYTINTSVGTPSIQWCVVVKGHPKPIVMWRNNKNETIKMENGIKYEANYDSVRNRTLIKVKNIQIKDFGYYTLVAINNETVKKNFFLNVTAKPSIVLDVKPFQLINSRITAKCYALANPKPEFQWYFKPCESTKCDYRQINGAVSKIEEFKFLSQVTINIASESGYLKCFAANHQGNSSVTKGFVVSDIKNGFDIFSLNSDVDVDNEKGIVTIARGDTATVTCGASNKKYSNISWLLNNKLLTDKDRYTLTRSSTQYSNKLELKIEHAEVSYNGRYSCKITNEIEEHLYKNLNFTIANPQAPKIINSALQDMELALPEKLILYCNVSGVPKPTITWYKEGVIFDTSEDRIHISQDNKKIVFSNTIEQDGGTYKCEAKNRMGGTEMQRTVTFKNSDREDHSWLIAVIVLLSLVSIGAIVFILIKIRKEKELQRELKILGLANFEKGAVENINPDLGIDEQAELLPYDRKWEFPIEHLKLGKQLGSGAFGVVMKGVAKQIVEEEESTTVAVKMVKKNADHIYIKALASELKIMVHLGKHLNVVNLLGACTKNVAKRELLVIVEFCRFGNLQNYLLRHRDNYIDQVDPKTGKIDCALGQELINRSYSVSSDQSNAQSPLLKYAALAFSSGNNQAVASPSSNGCYRLNPNAYPTTDMTVLSQGEEGVIISNNSVQPDWRSNYKGDYKGKVKPICTKDLVAWAFQVAQGMEYLASRKVLHGDLAARNILLTDNNIVKICDFGLAKSMYKNDNYKKRGNGPLPLKWMAIESIRDRVFSTQSDVWSFGIVLWEFFSLARTPYPGMDPDERLYQKLLDGYRMESPQYSPHEVYRMMTDCWSATPLARPSFQRLSERLGKLLDDSTIKHYIELNNPYLAMNTQRLGDGQSDYLAMLSSPTFEALSSPHYVNEMVGQEPSDSSGYLSMKPNIIFSPRVEEGPVFDFNLNNRAPLNSDRGDAMEMMPMLRRSSDSGCDTSIQSPITPDAFSNPSYHIPPELTQAQCGNQARKLVRSCDNYVNMSQSKEKMMNQDSPLLDTKEKDSEHYVNNTSRDWAGVM